MTSSWLIRAAGAAWHGNRESCRTLGAWGAEPRAQTLSDAALVIVVTILAQVAIAIGMHWDLFPWEMVRFGQRDALSYLLYLVGGCVVALHFD